MICEGGSAFSLTSHACRYCGGRILQAGDQFRCASCGVVGMGNVAAVCGCGAFPSVKGGGYRCGENPAKSPENPAEIVIHWAPATASPSSGAARRIPVTATRAAA